MFSQRRFSRPAAAVAVALLAPAALSGCGALGLGDDDERAAGAEEILAAFYPLQFVTQRVVGDLTEVDNLVTPGGEPHDLELTPEQTGRVNDADLIVFLSQFQPAVDSVVEQSGGDRGLDLAEFVNLLPAEDHEHAEDEHADEDHEHADEHADEHAEEDHEHSEDEHSEEDHSDHDHSGHDHDHGDHDPHFWLDPLRLADAGDAIAERLAEVDADNADAYRANAEDLRSELEELDVEYADGLASCERTTVVVNHDAFGYLDRYGLEFRSIVGLTPDAEPTPAVRAELEDLVGDEGLTTIFAERLASPADAESLAASTGLEVEVLDPIEGLTDETADEDYLSLMRANLSALAEANGC